MPAKSLIIKNLNEDMKHPYLIRPTQCHYFAQAIVWDFGI